MEKWLGKYSNFFYALLRIVAGALFACHGGQKLFGSFGGQKQSGLLFVAGVIEFFGGILIAVGLFSSLAAFVSAGQMAVAFFKQHAPAIESMSQFRDAGWYYGFWPIVNRGELAVLYCFIFLYIASHGSGILSIDSLRGRGRGR